MIGYGPARSLLLREQDGRQGMVPTSCKTTVRHRHCLPDLRFVHLPSACAVLGVSRLGTFSQEDPRRRSGTVLNSPGSVPTPVFAAQFNKVEWSLRGLCMNWWWHCILEAMKLG